MINLLELPEWGKNNDQLWELIHKRNGWFVRLRYLAITFTFFFILFARTELLFSLSQTQLLLLSGLVIVMTLYNILFHRKVDEYDIKKSRELVFRLSFSQVIVDLSALAILVYLTGGVESPFVFFFIFHTIIGSIILPRKMMIVLAGLIPFAFTSLVFLEFAKVIPHFPMNGLFLTHLYTSLPFVVISVIFFSIVIIVSIAIVTGITSDIFQLEEDLFNSLQKLSQTDKDKQRYVMAIVHEIKTPLTAIHSYLNVILKKMLGEVPPAIEDRLHRSFERSDEAIKLVNSVLRISRLKLLDELELSDFNITTLLNDIILKLKPVTDDREIMIEYDYDPVRIINYYGDRNLFRMALFNVIGNAIKYNNAHGKILISLKQEPEGICLTISDTGVGIPAHELPNVFKDSFRVSNLELDGMEGAGFGLSIVKNIIEKHRGTVTIKSPSTLGKSGKPGTEVEIYVPYKG